MPALNRWLQRGLLDGELSSGLGWRDKFGGGLAHRMDQDPIAEVNEPTDQIPGNTSTPFSIAIGGQDTGVVNFLGDRDWFSVTLTAGEVYIFTLTGSGGTPLSDPYLVLYNSAGVQIAFNDDADFPVDFNSVLTFTPATSGTYYLGAQAFDDSFTGGYTLTADISTPLDAINWMQTMTTTSIDVYFATAGQVFNGETALRNWTTSEVNAAMAALNTFAQVTTLTFNQVFSPTGAEMVLTLADMEGLLGYFQVGTPYGFFNPNEVGWDATGLQQGGYGFVTLIHELGHGLGLAHPHDNGGGSTIMPGVAGPFDFYGDHLLNQGVFTTMSYNDGWPSHPGANPASLSGLGWQGTPMALDIALLQQFYGANTTANSGNTTYTMQSTNYFYRAIWDVGGIDTIVYNGATRSVIDLRAATVEYEIGGGGWISYADGVQGGFTIAQGVVIENAAGGSSDDTMSGNSAVNQLSGRDGADVLHGGGNDILLGGNGLDRLYVLPGDVADGGAGVDTVENLDLSSATTNITYDIALAMSSTGLTLGGYTIRNIEAFTLTTGSGDDILIAPAVAGQSVWDAGGGFDRVIVDFSATSQQVILNLASTLSTADGSIWLHNVEAATFAGGSGNDHASGGAFAETLIGNDGNDTLGGEGGNDLLSGSGGEDALNGGAGVDTGAYALISGAATWQRNFDGSWTVTSADGTDSLTSVEFLSFTDHDVFLDRAQRTFSGNGTSDVLFRRSDGIMASWEVTGTTINAASFLPTAGAEWSVLGTGDVSGDGRDDVLWQRADGLVYAWVMNGGAVSAAVGLTGIGAEWTFLGLGDFNGDLTDDFAWRRNDGVVFTWTMQNTAIQSANGVTGLGADWQIAGFGDFNGDGRDDFLWRNSSTGQSVVWHMNGSTIQGTGPTSVQAGLDWAVVGVGDTDGDGRDDIVLQRASDGMIAVWAMNGTTAVATDVAPVNPNDWTVRGIGDYNGDGREDILWQHDNGLVYVWLMNGATIQSAGALSGIGDDWSII